MDTSPEQLSPATRIGVTFPKNAMTCARRKQVSLLDTPNYRCVSRCAARCQSEWFIRHDGHCAGLQTFYPSYHYAHYHRLPQYQIRCAFLYLLLLYC